MNVTIIIIAPESVEFTPIPVGARRITDDGSTRITEEGDQRNTQQNLDSPVES